MTIRKTRHTSVAREVDAVEAEATERAFNLACDFLEDNGFDDAAAKLAGWVFDGHARVAVEGEL